MKKNQARKKSSANETDSQGDDRILDFISGYVSLTAEERQIVKSQNLLRSCPKGSILLAEGELARECYFVISGCVRRYYLVDGEEKTTGFYTENQAITPVSYISGKPSAYFLSCLEDSVLALGSAERNKTLIEKIPQLEFLVNQMNSQLLVENEISFDHFKTLSPELRYLHLLENRPDLLNRVPQYHLATYLGITPVSLSRLRKRISGKHHS